MSGICRLCLSFSNQNMWPLSDCDGIVYNNTSFSIHISRNNSLPSQVCSVCIKKLTDFNKFYLQVQRNEEILLRELNNGGNALNKLYEQIKNRIKKEVDEPFHDNINIDTINNIIENENILKHIKPDEDFISEDVNFDSEDELPLLTIKDANYDETQKTELSFNTSSECTKANSIYTQTHNAFNFKCLTCFEKFISQNKLLNHYNNVHKIKEKTKGNCYTILEGDEKNYKCNQCEKKYDNIRAVNKHALVHNEESFHCKVCGRTYKTVSEIIRHGRAHDGTKILCSFGCGFATVYSGALKSHERRHREDFKYKCETCGKSFQVKTWYEQHQNVHTGAKPYVCDICGLAFHMDRYLKAHCGSVHPEASSKKRYVCVQCSKPCGTMKALTLHLKEHGITSSVLCDLCGKTLSSTEQLSIHRRLHMGLKPHSCSTCEKSFAKRSTLALHQAAHRGARVACAACPRRYSQRSALRRHVRKHHSESAKKCPKCDVTYSTQTELTAHQKICSS